MLDCDENKKAPQRENFGSLYGVARDPFPLIASGASPLFFTFIILPRLLPSFLSSLFSFSFLWLFLFLHLLDLHPTQRWRLKRLLSG